MLPYIPITVKASAASPSSIALCTVGPRSDFDEVRDLVRRFIAEPLCNDLCPYLKKLLELSTPTNAQLTAYRSGAERSLDTFLVDALVARNVMHIVINHLANLLIGTTSQDVILMGLEVVRNLSRSERCQSAIAKHGSFISWILKMGREEGLDERAQYLLFGIVNNVVSEPELATRLYAAHRHVVDVLVDCIRSETRQAQNREWAVAALSNLANAAAVRVPLASTPRLVQTLVENCRDAPSETMAEWGLLAILGLTAADANHLSLFGNHSLVELLVEVVDPTSRFSHGARDLALSSVANLCRSETPRLGLARQPSLLDHLSTIADAQDFDEDVREGAVKALSNMAASDELAQVLANDKRLLGALLSMWRGELPVDSTLEAASGALLDSIGWPAERVTFAHSAVLMLAVRAVPRLGVTSSLRSLPHELIRRIVEACGWGESIVA
jgi:hypothetical protein